MRLKVIRIFFFLTLFFVVMRLGYWQVIRADDLSAKGESQRLETKQVLAKRGTVFFSDNSILASIQPAFLVFAQPKEINIKLEAKRAPSTLLSPESKGDIASEINEYKQNYAQKVAEIFWEDDQKHSTDSGQIIEEKKRIEQIDELKKGIFDKLSQNLYWISLGRKVNLDVKQRLEALNLIGLGFQDSSKRFYPEGSSSAHLLGFVGSDVFGSETGYFGLEGFYNGELKGRHGTLTLEKDALGVPILIGKFLTKESREGKDLVLNIDRTVQYIAETNIMKGVEKYGAKSGSVVIMDPKTGNILAMASSPAYDPQLPDLYPKENLKNPVTADSYEPGSTFKVLVMAAALNEEVVKPDTICDICSGPFSLSGYTIRTWNNKYHSGSNMTDVIVHSDNTGMVFISGKLGIDKMYDYIKKFGFGEMTNIDLQDEASPSIRDKKDWKEIDLATSSFGQGISATPLQIVRAVSAIANGGKLMEPHLVSEIKDGKSVYKINPKIVGEPVSEDTANSVKNMMVDAVDKGEAQYYKKAAGMLNYKVAGKTGTAQIPVAGHYDPTKTIASFVGFAPADDPKFVMLVRYVEPSSSIFGADTAAPTFFNIAKDLLLYYNIPPTEVPLSDK